MSLQVFERMLGLFRGAGEAFCDASVLALLLLPAVVFLPAFFLYLFCKKFRPRTKAWYPILGDVCLFLLLALFLVGGDAEDVFPVLALLLCAKAAYLLLFGALCLIPAEKRPKQPKKRTPAEEEWSEITESAPPERRPESCRPQKIRCFTDGACVRVDKDVRLDHIASVLERLKELPLGAGDRLETQKIEELFGVYRAKGELSAKEADTLNDVLASLLKMMAKYDL